MMIVVFYNMILLRTEISVGGNISSFRPEKVFFPGFRSKEKISNRKQEGLYIDSRRIGSRNDLLCVVLSSSENIEVWERKNGEKKTIFVERGFGNRIDVSNYINSNKFLSVNNINEADIVICKTGSNIDVSGFVIKFSFPKHFTNLFLYGSSQYYPYLACKNTHFVILSYIWDFIYVVLPLFLVIFVVRLLFLYRGSFFILFGQKSMSVGCHINENDNSFIITLLPGLHIVLKTWYQTKNNSNKFYGSNIASSFEIGDESLKAVTSLHINENDFDIEVKQKLSSFGRFTELLSSQYRTFLLYIMNSILLSKNSFQIMNQFSILCECFDYAGLYLFELHKDGFMCLLECQERMGGLGKPSDKIVLEAKCKVFGETPSIFIENDMIYIITKVKIGEGVFVFSRSLSQKTYVNIGFEDFFHQFLLIILYFWHKSLNQHDFLLSSSSVLSLIQNSGLFSISEYSDNKEKSFSSFGSLFRNTEDDNFFHDNIKSALSDSDYSRLIDEIQGILSSGTKFSKLSFKASVPSGEKWVCISGIRKNDEYHDSNVAVILFQDITKFHQTEVKHHEALQEFQLASSLLGIHRFSSIYEDDFLMVNHDLFIELGHVQDLDRTLFRIVHPEDVHKLKECKEKNNVVIRLSNSEGAYFWYSVVISSKNTKTKGFLFSVHELTELQSTAQSTRDCFEIASSTGSFKFWVFDSSSNCSSSTGSNNSVFPIVSFQILYSIVHPDDLHILESQNINLITKTTVIEARLKTDDSSDYHWFSLTLVPSTGKQVLCFAMNIDEKKRTRDLIAKEESLLDMAFTYTDVHMWCFENNRYNNKIITSEPDQEKMVTMSWNTLDHNLVSEYQDDIKAAFIRALKGEEKLDIEAPFFFESLHWLLLRGLMVQDKQYPRLMGIYMDLTHIKEMYNEAGNQKKAAEEASMAKSMFLANMSHEIRTPLNGMCGLLEVLQTSELHPEQRELTNCIQNSFIELLELLNDTLDLAKIESKKLISVSAPFSPWEVMSQLQDHSFLRRKSTHVELIVYQSPLDPLYYIGDSFCFMRIVTNLISNAIKFTEKGQISIILSNNPLGFKISITDTGKGIPKEFLDAIIDHFENGNMMTVYDNSCVGVGLSLVTEMVRLLSGNIEVCSCIGKGSTFTVFFPFNPIEFPQPPKIPLSSNVVGYSGNNKMIKEFSEFYQFKFNIINSIEDFSNADIIVVDEDCIPSYINISSPLLKTKIVAIETNKDEFPNPKFHYFQKPTKPHHLHKFFSDIINGNLVINPKADPKDFRQMRVLAVDDNSTNQLVLEKMLNKLKCQFKLVSDGQEALKAIELEEFDVILMDQYMPILDGPSATKMIRDLGMTIPIICMTASLMPEEEETCRKAGMNAFLCKPVTLGALEKTLLSV